MHFHNPYLSKYYSGLSERERFGKKVSTGLVNSFWIQFGTDIKLLENEINYLRNNDKYNELNIFGNAQGKVIGQ